MKLSRKPENLRKRILLIKYILFFATTFARSCFAAVNIHRLETEMSAERRVGLYLSDVNHKQSVDKLSSDSTILSLTKIKKAVFELSLTKYGRADKAELIAHICKFSCMNPPPKEKVIHVPKLQAI